MKKIRWRGNLFSSWKLMFSVFICSVFSLPLILKVVTWYEIIFTELCHDLRVETVLFTKTFS